MNSWRVYYFFGNYPLGYYSYSNLLLILNNPLIYAEKLFETN